MSLLSEILSTKTIVNSNSMTQNFQVSISAESISEVDLM